MSRRPVMLLDQDGVLLDNDRYDAEWERHAGDAFAARLGGDRARWARLSEDVWRETYRRHVEQTAGRAPAQWWDDANEEWIAECCRQMGVPAPPTRTARIEAAETALRFFFRRTGALVPGAGDAIRRLARDFELHMASGNPAFIVEIVLERYGVRSLVGEPFGSDLVGAHKNIAPEFYASILERLGKPEHFVVVDDESRCLEAVRALGGATVCVSKAGSTDPDAHLSIASLAQLPELVRSLVA